jgi:hypothetical protein
MPTQRGFVEAIEIGRAGLASAFLIHADGTRATYFVADLDADPERFNERLSKLGLLRDAMDRAEPVEIEFSNEGDKAGQIDRVRRLTRDALAPPGNSDRVAGTVIGVGLAIRTGPENPEPSDACTLALLVDGTVERFLIDMQTPERGAADAMATMARAAQAEGALLEVDYDTKTRIVTALERGGTAGRAGGGEGIAFAGFVETIAHLPVTDLMLATVTTAPPFSSTGNVVELVPFDPVPRYLLVLRGAPEYALIEAALRDKLRIDVLAEEFGKRGDGNDGDTTGGSPVVGVRGRRTTGTTVTEAATKDEASAAATKDGNYGGLLPEGPFVLVRGLRLSAPLCSASRPVWIRIDRQALDAGPDAHCVAGLPTSDLTPRTLHEVNLPYRADWIAHGCFNHGVYRFEIDTDAQFELYVDDEKLCLFQDAKGEAWFGHACLEGDHEVRVAFADWSCGKAFDIDVYRIR